MTTLWEVRFQLLVQWEGCIAQPSILLLVPPPWFWIRVLNPKGNCPAWCCKLETVWLYKTIYFLQTLQTSNLGSQGTWCAASGHSLDGRLKFNVGEVFTVRMCLAGVWHHSPWLMWVLGTVAGDWQPAFNPFQRSHLAGRCWSPSVCISYKAGGEPAFAHGSLGVRMRSQKGSGKHRGWLREIAFLCCPRWCTNTWRSDILLSICVQNFLILELENLGEMRE